MQIPFVLLPFFVQVALIFALLFRMGGLRTASVRRVWPERAQQAGDAYENQFELPLLFLALAPLAIITRKDDVVFVALAWVFVLLRVAHAAVHATSNHAPTRFRLFAAGALVLLLMWVVFALQMLLGF